MSRMRELMGYLISMAALHDGEAAKLFADELELLLQKLEAKVAELEAEPADVCVGHRTIWDTSEGCPYCRLADIAGLVKKWRSGDNTLISRMYADFHAGLETCADELQAELDKAK